MSNSLRESEMSFGKCPACKQSVEQFRVQPVTLGTKAEQAPSFYGAVISCPSCETILSVVPDPNVIAQDVEHRLKGRTG
jgi:hypothetical protein